MINKQILMFESNEKNFDILNILLKKDGYDCIPILDTEAFKNLEPKADGYDLILVNANISFVTIADIVKISEFNTSLPIPIIYIDSAKEYNKSNLEECFKNGVSDYIKKPYDAEEIVYRINRSCKQIYKLREYKLRLDKLANLVTVDQLSKATSKMQMQVLLKHRISHYNRYKEDTSIVYLSLANIDKLVGTFGLEKGEQIISHFSKLLKSFIRESDALARWAGSDFILLLTHTSEEGATFIAKKLKTKFNGKEIIQGIKPDLAFGITSFSEDDDLKHILERVKYALKEAKKQPYDKIAIA